MLCRIRFSCRPSQLVPARPAASLGGTRVHTLQGTCPRSAAQCSALAPNTQAGANGTAAIHTNSPTAPATDVATQAQLLAMQQQMQQMMALHMQSQQQNAMLQNQVLQMQHHLNSLMGSMVSAPGSPLMVPMQMPLPGAQPMAFMQPIQALPAMQPMQAMPAMQFTGPVGVQGGMMSAGQMTAAPTDAATTAPVPPPAPGPAAATTAVPAISSVAPAAASKKQRGQRHQERGSAMSSSRAAALTAASSGGASANTVQVQGQAATSKGNPAAVREGASTQTGKKQKQRQQQKGEVPGTTPAPATPKPAPLNSNASRTAAVTVDITEPAASHAPAAQATPEVHAAQATPEVHAAQATPEVHAHVVSGPAAAHGTDVAPAQSELTSSHKPQLLTTPASHTAAVGTSASGPGPIPERADPAPASHTSETHTPDLQTVSAFSAIPAVPADHKQQPQQTLQPPSGVESTMVAFDLQAYLKAKAQKSTTAEDELTQATDAADAQEAAGREGNLHSQAAPARQSSGQLQGAQDTATAAQTAAVAAAAHQQGQHMLPEQPGASNGAEVKRASVNVTAPAQLLAHAQPDTSATGPVTGLLACSDAITQAAAVLGRTGAAASVTAVSMLDDGPLPSMAVADTNGHHISTTASVPKAAVAETSAQPSNSDGFGGIESLAELRAMLEEVARNNAAMVAALQQQGVALPEHLAAAQAALGSIIRASTPSGAGVTAVGVEASGVLSQEALLALAAKWNDPKAILQLPPHLQQLLTPQSHFFANVPRLGAAAGPAGQSRKTPARPAAPSSTAGHGSSEGSISAAGPGKERGVAVPGGRRYKVVPRSRNASSSSSSNITTYRGKNTRPRTAVSRSPPAATPAASRSSTPDAAAERGSSADATAAVVAEEQV